MLVRKSDSSVHTAHSCITLGQADEVKVHHASCVVPVRSFRFRMGAFKIVEILIIHILRCCDTNERIACALFAKRAQPAASPPLVRKTWIISASPLYLRPYKLYGNKRNSLCIFAFCISNYMMFRKRETFRAKNERKKFLARRPSLATHTVSCIGQKNLSKFFSGKFPINYFRLNWFAFGWRWWIDQLPALRAHLFPSPSYIAFVSIKMGQIKSNGRKIHLFFCYVRNK